MFCRRVDKNSKTDIYRASNGVLLLYAIKNPRPFKFFLNKIKKKWSKLEELRFGALIIEIVTNRNCQRIIEPKLIQYFLKSD